MLYLRGAVSVDMGPAGRAVEWLKLAGGVGDYVVRVFGRNRREVIRRYVTPRRGMAGTSPTSGIRPASSRSATASSVPASGS